MNEMSVRTWQERFRAGDFSSLDRAVQCEAGWRDWFCREENLAGHLKKISTVVMSITEPFILDNYYVWFNNNHTTQGTMYDTAHFAPLDGNRDGKYFVVSLDDPRETMKWTLYTDRFGIDSPEFSCANVRDLIKYISRMASEMEQGFVPPFAAEKKAVGDYVLKHEGRPALCIRMDSPHLFAYQSSHDYESESWQYLQEKKMRRLALSPRRWRSTEGYMCLQTMRLPSTAGTI